MNIYTHIYNIYIYVHLSDLALCFVVAPIIYANKQKYVCSI